VRSYWPFDYLQCYVNRQTFHVQSVDGTLEWGWISGLPAGWLGASGIGTYDRTPKIGDVPRYSRYGFGWYFEPSGEYSGYQNPKHILYGKRWTARVRRLTIPHWSLAVVFAILPAFQFRAILRSQHRHRQGLCPRCGYDLRATPERCPECGTSAHAR
jgi:hypothetical protein